MSADDDKRLAALRALDYVQPGMKLGLGTGSTAAHFVRGLAARVAQGLDVVCVPTSDATEALARELAIPLTTLDATPYLDMTVDGADELDEELRLIKGGGGALLREKIVAMTSDRMIVIADASKKVATLGAFPLPIEVVRFGYVATQNMVALLAGDIGLGGNIVLRKTADGTPFVTDCGNYILDCHFGRIADPDTLDEALKMIPGVVEHGLFLGIADIAVIANNGTVTVIEPDRGSDD